MMCSCAVLGSLLGHCLLVFLGDVVRILPAELVSVLMSFFLFFLLLPLPSSSLPVSLLESFSVFRPAYLTYEEIS